MVLPDEARQRVLSYLAHQASKDVAAICDLIAEERSRVLRLLEGVSEEQAAFAPASGEWCIKEVVGHIASTEREVAAIIGRLAGVLDKGDWSGSGDLEEKADRSLAEQTSSLLQARHELLDVVAQITGDGGLDAKHDHPFFGPLNWKEWLAFQRVHDRDHADQIEAIQQSASYPKGT